MCYARTIRVESLICSRCVHSLFFPRLKWPKAILSQVYASQIKRHSIIRLFPKQTSSCYYPHIVLNGSISSDFHGLFFFKTCINLCETHKRENGTGNKLHYRTLTTQSLIFSKIFHFLFWKMKLKVFYLSLAFWAACARVCAYITQSIEMPCVPPSAHPAWPPLPSKANG